jgi:hypothetical protein
MPKVRVFKNPGNNIPNFTVVGSNFFDGFGFSGLGVLEVAAGGGAQRGLIGYGLPGDLVHFW